MQIFVATSNAGKLRDFAWAVSQPGAHGPGKIRIEPLPGLAHITAPPEDEPTFQGNARAKALYYAAFAPGQLVLADDSGLEVAALHGAPGVRSARYAEDMGFPHASASTLDARNNDALLHAMETVPPASRDARYRCSLVLARDSEVIAAADGVLDGVILTAPQGDSGFGYDPLFLIPESGETMAELAPELRLRFSHRGRALRNLLTDLARPGR